MSDMNIYGITNEAGLSMDKYDVNDKLMDLGIPEEVVAQGEVAIKEYAFAHVIDLTELQAPQAEKTAQPSIGGAGDNIKADFESQLEALGVPAKIIAQGKEAVQAYALSKGISLPRPPSSGINLNFKS